MKILVSGSGGMVGSALLPVLRAAGHQITRLVRRPSAPLGPEDSTVQWNPETGEIDSRRLEGIEAVVHLAGENIAARRWTPAQKARIRDSRVQGTALLSQRLAGLTQPPATLVAASAIGYYGNRGEELLNEDSSSGNDFLSEVCRQWEAASLPAAEKGIRVVRLRLGIVLSPRGGALAKMLPPFKLGAGGRIGTGQQYMSWIALDDAVGAIGHALTDSNLSGPVNAVAPPPRHQPGIHQDPGQGAVSPHPLPHAGVCGSHGPWRDGRRPAAREQPGGTPAAGGLRLLLPVPDAGSRPAPCPGQARSRRLSQVRPQESCLRFHPWIPSHSAFRDRPSSSCCRTKVKTRWAGAMS